MDRVRARISRIAAAAIVLQMAVITLSMVRVEHTHAGIAAPDCPMHHEATEPQPAAHAPHHHGNTGSQTPSTDERLSCSCAGDLTAIHYGPHAIAPSPALVLPPAPATLVVSAGELRPASLLLPPDSPPPRVSLSSLS